MKYIKTYEDHHVNAPNIDDWIIGNLSPNIDDELNDFISSNIGKVVEIGYETHHEDDLGNLYKAPFYVVKYDVEIPARINIWFQHDDYGYSIGLEAQDIKYWSENKEELEIILASRKYNL